MPRRLLIPGAALVLASLALGAPAQPARAAAHQQPARRADRQADRLRSAVEAVDRRHPGRVSVAMIGRGVLRTAGPQLQLRAASLTKVLIVEAALAGGPLRPAEFADARAALTRSDNDAATRVWRAAGGTAGVARFVARLRLAGTHPVSSYLQPWDGWVTTAADQARVLAHVAASGGVVATLLANVRADQRWGVGSAAPAGTRVIGKDGWLPLPDGWLAHSAGCVTSAARQRVCLAVLTEDSPSYAEGARLASDAARAALEVAGVLA